MIGAQLRQKPGTDTGRRGGDVSSDIKPVLRWAGSKRHLIPELLRHLPAGKRYIEPFAGSACLFFAAKPEVAVLADRNAEVIGFYRTLRARPRAVSKALREWNTDAKSYYTVRSLNATSLNAVERAARFLYLNRLCFNGLYRTNRRGAFNVPLGRNPGALPSEKNIVGCAAALRACQLRTGDFERTLADAGEGDVVYLDPPYTQHSAHAYGVYGYGAFAGKDLDRMFTCLQALDDAGARFLFSYTSEVPLSHRLRVGWSAIYVRTRNQIAASPASRGARTELIVMNSFRG